MNIGTLNSKPAEVNGTKPKSLRYRRAKCIIGNKRAEQGKLSLLGSKSLLWVFSATILRPLTSARNYATIADRKSANSEGVTHTKAYSAAYCKSEKKIPSQNSLPLTNKFDWVLCGGDKGIRTPDLYVANVSRYQLCYIPAFQILLSSRNIKYSTPCQLIVIKIICFRNCFYPHFR